MLEFPASLSSMLKAEYWLRMSFTSPRRGDQGWSKVDESMRMTVNFRRSAAGFFRVKPREEGAMASLDLWKIWY